jgi:hypothetical protein
MFARGLDVITQPGRRRDLLDALDDLEVHAPALLAQRVEVDPDDPDHLWIVQTFDPDDYDRFVVCEAFARFSESLRHFVVSIAADEVWTSRPGSDEAPRAFVWAPHPG